jgi:hypothetical protein
MGEGERDLDVVAARVVADLLARSHLLAPGGVAEAIAAAAQPLGVVGARIYLADLQQRNLRAMPGRGDRPQVLAIGSTAAGRAYQQVRIQQEREGGDRAGRRVWIPLLDGAERLGVLELDVGEASEAMLARYQMLASLAGLMIASKSIYSDTYAQAMRSQLMALQGEMVWAFMASRTFATERVLVAGALEPAYEVGGDAFDYSLLGDRLHVSIFDATGHDLAAGLMTSVAMASCRSTRRSAGTLREIVARADQAIASQFGGTRFVTALLCDLDIATGEFTWIPCGHPPPLLFRGNKMIKELARKPLLPLGLTGLPGIAGDGQANGELYSDADTPVYTERLQPGDRLLLYTDGVTEGRAADGTRFGEQRLIDFIIDRTDAGTSAPETLRQLNQAITDYQHDRLSDDATIVLMEWMPADPEQQLTA